MRARLKGDVIRRDPAVQCGDATVDAVHLAVWLCVTRTKPEASGGVAVWRVHPCGHLSQTCVSAWSCGLRDHEPAGKR